MAVAGRVIIHLLYVDWYINSYLPLDGVIRAFKLSFMLMVMCQCMQSILGGMLPSKLISGEISYVSFYHLKEIKSNYDV